MRSPEGLVLLAILVLVVVLGLDAPPAAAAEALAPGAAAPPPAAPATQPAGFRGYRVLQDHPDRLLVELPNRLLVVAQEVHAAPVVSAQVFIKTGSIYEQQHVGAGLSHFLEHLLAAGSTATRSREQTNQLLGRIGAQTNAATGLESVHYYINTTSPYAGQAVELLSDWMQHNAISPEEYQRQRSVIQREFEMGEGDPGRILWKLTQQARYRAHPARHPTIGYLDEFLAISRDEIAAFYHRMYVPNNMVFVVVGDIDRRKIVDQVAALWAGAPAAELPALAFPREPEIASPKSLAGTADIQRPRLRLAWPGTKLAAEGDYALDLLAVLLGQGESSRLVRTVRDEQKAVNAISAYNMSFHWGEGFFGIDAEVATARPAATQAPAPGVDDTQAALDRARQAILDQVERVRRDGVAPEELARAKRQTIAHVIYSAQTAEGLADRLATDLISMGDPDYLQRYARAIEGVSATDVQAAAQRYLAGQRLISVTLLPNPAVVAGAATAPAGASAGQAAPRRNALQRPPEDPEAATFARVPVDLDNAPLVRRLTALEADHARSSAGATVTPVQRFVLPNGLRVLVGRSTVVPAVAMQMYHLGGLLADEPGREGLANAAATMRIKGTKARTAEALAAEVENLGASLSTAAGNNTAYTQAVCLKEDWPQVLALLADVALNPTFPDDQWQKLQPRLLASIDRQTDTWSGELRVRFLQQFYGEHQWGRPVTGRREVVAALKPDDLRRFYYEHLGASEAVLAVFGDVDPAEVARQAGRLLAGLPPRPIVPFQAPAPAAPRSRVVQLQTNKPLAAVQVGLGPGVTRASADYPAVQVLSKVLSSFPAGWLEEELRGRGPGLVYAVGAGPMAGVVPGHFSVVFNCAPASTPEALARARVLLERLRTDLVPAEDLARAKAAVLADEFLDKQANGDRAAEAALDALYGLGVDEPQRFVAEVQGLTPEMLRVVAQTYLRNPVTVVLTHQALEEEKLR